MKNLGRAAVLFCMVLAFDSSSSSQVPKVVGLDLGVGGGVAVPLGTFSDTQDTGLNFGGKLRISGLLPFRLVGMASYSKLNGKEVSTAIPLVGTLNVVYADAKVYQLGVGVEIPVVPAPIVKPYVVGEVSYYNLKFGDNGNSRLGLGAGGGIEISLGGMLHLDGTVKYQALNLGGKDANEKTFSQVSATAALVFKIM